MYCWFVAFVCRSNVLFLLSEPIFNLAGELNVLSINHYPLCMTDHSSSNRVDIGRLSIAFMDAHSMTYFSKLQKIGSLRPPYTLCVRLYVYNVSPVSLGHLSKPLCSIYLEYGTALHFINANDTFLNPCTPFKTSNAHDLFIMSGFVNRPPTHSNALSQRRLDSWLE